eukprot:UN23815
MNPVEYNNLQKSHLVHALSQCWMKQRDHLVFSLKKFKIYGNGKLKIYAIFSVKKKRTKLRTMRNMIIFQESHATKNDGIFHQISINLQFFSEKKRN